MATRTLSRDPQMVLIDIAEVPLFDPPETHPVYLMPGGMVYANGCWFRWIKGAWTVTPALTS